MTDPLGVIIFVIVVSGKSTINLIRFGVSLERELLLRFDHLIKEEGFPTRSEAIKRLIREKLVEREWVEGKEVVGTLTLIYNHHKRELVNKLLDIQHEFYTLVISSQHIHLDHDNCIEVLIVKGSPQKVKRFSHKLKSTKGIKHSSLTATSTGKELP